MDAATSRNILKRNFEMSYVKGTSAETLDNNSHNLNATVKQLKNMANPLYLTSIPSYTEL